MASLPNRQAVDKRWLTPAEFEALLMSGAETLCPSTDWEDDGPRGPIYAYRSTGQDVNEKLVIVTDTLHRLREWNRERCGLIFVKQTHPDGVPALRNVLVDPTVREQYLGPSAWLPPVVDVVARICQNRTNVTRHLGRSAIAKYYIARARRIVPVTTARSSFAITRVQQLGSDIVFEMKPSSTPPPCDHVVQIRGVHDEIDGHVVVRRSTENGFCTAAPQKLNVKGLIYSRSETSVTGAEGSTVFCVDRSRAVYQVRFHEIADLPPPRSFHAASRSSRNSSGSSVPSFRQRSSHPVLPLNLHEARRAGLEPFGAAFRPLPQSAPKKTAPANPFFEMRKRDAAKLSCDESERKKAISVLFSAENAESSLRRLVERFGLQKVKDAFRAASLPPPPPPGQLLRDLQQRRSLIETPHQETILEKITNGENWLFRLPRTEKVATYFEMIKLLLDVEPTTAVIVTSTREQATELVTVLGIVQCRFNLDRLRAELLVGKGGSQEKRSRGASIPLRANVVIATPGMIESMLHRGELNLAQFRLMIWDDCEKAKGNFAGSAIIQRYRQLPPDAQTSLKIYAFTSHFHVAGGNVVHLSELCANLCISLPNHYVVDRQGKLLSGLASEKRLHIVVGYSRPRSSDPRRKRVVLVMEAFQDVDDTLLDFGFNQDASCFACGTSGGFRIFSCEPFKRLFRRDFETGGVGLVQMLFRCNILALSGGGVTPRFPPTNVMIWDDDQRKCIAELSFRTQVRSVRLRRDRIVVCQESKVSVYNFADLNLLHTIETAPNSRGLVALSCHPDATVLACPGLQSGKVRVELYDRAATRFISAHDSAVSCLELSLDGRILATASERGTLIRVWNTATTNILQEVRRGLDTAIIFSIAISRSCDYLAVSSDKGTVHIFPLRCFTTSHQRSDEEEAPNNHAVTQTMSSMLSYVRGIVPLPNYFQSEWSLAQFRVPEDCWSVVAFGQSPNSVYVLNQKGSFYQVEFDPVKGGPCTQKRYLNFLEME